MSIEILLVLFAASSIGLLYLYLEQRAAKQLFASLGIPPSFIGALIPFRGYPALALQMIQLALLIPIGIKIGFWRTALVFAVATSFFVIVPVPRALFLPVFRRRIKRLGGIPQF